MTQITRILAPVDFSDHSERAFRYATWLATRLGATVELLHVVDDPFVSGAWNTEIYVANVPQVLEQVIVEGNRRLTNMAASAQPGLDVTAKVITGQPAHAIVEHARTGLFDLIVMGTHGRTGISHMVMGSVAERVTRRAHCPVLTIRGTNASTATETAGTAVA